MSFIGKNIRKIRSIKKLSQTAFADLFSLSRTSVGAYEEGRAEPKIDTIISIANYFKISIDTLLNKELTVNELYHFDIFKSKYLSGNEEVEKPLPKPSMAIPLVSAKDTVEYLTNFANKDFALTLTSIQYSGFPKEVSRAFELNTHGMKYANAGLSRGDILFCSKVERNIDQLSKGTIYTVIYPGKINTFRLIEKSDTLTFKGDNPDFSEESFAMDDILEIWEVKAYFTTSISAPNLIEDRVSTLEVQLKELQELVQKLNK